jgi:hypothetical protein
MNLIYIRYIYIYEGKNINNKINETFILLIILASNQINDIIIYIIILIILLMITHTHAYTTVHALYFDISSLLQRQRKITRLGDRPVG